MACEGGMTFETKPIQSATQYANVTLVYSSIQFMNDLLAFYLTLAPCDDIRDAVESTLMPAYPGQADINWPTSLFPNPCETGTQFDAPTQFNVTWGGDLTFGFSIDINYTVDGAPGGFVRYKWDTEDPSQPVFYNFLVVGFPLILGVNCQQVTIAISDSGSPGHNPTAKLSDIVSAMTAWDYDTWFCCASTLAGYSCCGSAPSFAPGFLIPPPVSPSPEEENISTPITRTPLYLSNHTYQFTNNFGRVQK